MNARPLLLGLFFCVISIAEEAPRAIQVAEPPAPFALDGQDRVTSRTGQFNISGGTSGDRGNISMLAEEAKNELEILTEEKQAKPRPFDLASPATGKPADGKHPRKVPILIVLHGKSGDPVPPRTTSLEILKSEAGYILREGYHLSRGIEHERFKFATTSALIYERALRDRPVRESDTPFHVPPWLTDGLREATAWRLNQSDRRLYEALFKTGGLFKIDDLFALDERGFEEMDAAMRAAFRVSSGSLVMALLQQQQGKEGFRNFLTEVAAFEGEMPALLRKHFPELNLSETSLSKWWALQLAQIGARNLTTDILTVAETEKSLSESLRLNFRTAEGIIQQKELSAWPEIAALPEPERVKSVYLAQDSLVRLSYRCFPSYRPIIAEYQLVLSAIAKNTTKDFAARLADLTDRRATMTAKAQRARDYLDWFEITRARETSGAFDDYMRLKERLKANPHRRNDPLSKYLDRMDAIFRRKGDPEGPVISPEPTALPPLDLSLPE
jgi:hypothetical protein